MNVMEVALEDQILAVDSVEEVAPDENPFKKLHRKEERLTAKLQEEQEAEARAQDRFQRAQTRLQRRRKRVARIQGKLSLVREQLAELQMTDQLTVYKNASDNPAVDGDEEMAKEQEFSLPQQEDTSPTSFTYEPIEVLVDSEFETTLETTPVERSDVEHFEQEQETSSSAPLPSVPFESTSDSEASSSNVESDGSHASISEYEVAQELEASTSSFTESSMPTTQEQEPEATLDSITNDSEPEVIDDNDIASETNTERKPTKPLRLEQPGLPAVASHASNIQSAKEAWIAAESAMHNIRNAANGLATSISFLSQTDGLSNEFIEELARKQADTNRELQQAQDAARAAYERFVQAERDAQNAGRQSMNTSESSLQQENDSLPPAEENGLDQTAKLHAVRLYTEW